MQTKSRFDPNSPEIKAYLNELAHQFVREGIMVAFPTCLPGMTTPITHDESHITALDINSEGHVYGGTSGRQAHLFGAAFHGLTGIVGRRSRSGCNEHGSRLLRCVRRNRLREWTARRPRRGHTAPESRGRLDPGMGPRGTRSQR